MKKTGIIKDDEDNVRGLPVKVNKRRRVIQTNPVLEGNYRLGERAMRLLKVIISQIDDKRDQEFFVYEFTTTDLYAALGLESTQRKFDDLGEAIQELRKVDIHIPGHLSKDGADVFTGMLQKGRVHQGQNRTTVQIDGELKPFLLQVQGKFTKYELSEVLSFRGAYTLRFYEWFKAEQYKASKSGSWYVAMELHEIRRRLGMLNKQGKVNLYPRWQDFRRRVLDSVVEEISEKTDYLVSWEAGQKRAVRDVKFIIEPKPKTGAAARIARPKAAKPAAAKEAESEETRVRILSKLSEKCGEDLRDKIKERHGEDLAKLLKSGLMSPKFAEDQAMASALLAFEDEIRAATTGVRV